MRIERPSAVAAWLSASPTNARARLMRAQLALDTLSNARSTDAAAWESARAQILGANRLAPTDPLVLEAYYDSFVAQGIEPPAGAQNALFRAFNLVPQDGSIRFKLAADFEARGMVDEAITIIKPIAVQAHDSTGKSEKKRERRKRLEAKYREVGDRVDADLHATCWHGLKRKLRPKIGSGTPPLGRDSLRSRAGETAPDPPWAHELPALDRRTTSHTPAAVQMIIANQDASRPKAPPDRISGPDNCASTSPFWSIPDTGTSQISPWVKFHAAWRPIGTHRLRVSM